MLKGFMVVLWLLGGASVGSGSRDGIAFGCACIGLAIGIDRAMTHHRLDQKSRFDPPA